MVETKGKGPSEPIELYVSMTWGLKGNIDVHIANLGESNRSAWIRSAIRAQMRQEKEELARERES